MPTVVVFSGAGMSADSGLPTFRGAGGLWENDRFEVVAHHDAWLRDPAMVLRFYRDRWLGYSGCQPHAGHHALARLEQKYPVIHITQNVDSLLELAGCSNVVHLHGRLARGKCEWHQDIVMANDVRYKCHYKVDLQAPIELGDSCPLCGGQLRPDIVLFEEAVDMAPRLVARAHDEVERGGGIFICVGSSLQVYPAAGFVQAFGAACDRYLVDLNPPAIPGFKAFRGPASEQLPLLVEQLMGAPG